MDIESSEVNVDPNDNFRVLLCFSGSVATIKIPELCVSLLSLGNIELIIVGSGDAALHFLTRSQRYNPTYGDRFIKEKCEELMVYDSDEWNMWESMGDPVLHIELRKWADILLLAPASADIIAKISHGVSDSLLLSIIRAWDFDKPCIICPAMNTLMWTHPVTQQSLDILTSWGWTIVNPVVKTLACNEKGSGALASVQEIVEIVKKKAFTIPKSKQYLASDLLSGVRRRRGLVSSHPDVLSCEKSLAISVIIPIAMLIIAHWR
jgi:phosphopantothenoylcysteine decarboxylase